jgi:hypothetical protein
MSPLRRNAQHARALLGDIGTLRRVASVATLYQDGEDSWAVESEDSSGEGGLYVTAFHGPDARERASEYAREKYSGFRVRRPD